MSDVLDNYFKELEEKKQQRQLRLKENAPNLIEWCDEKAKEGELVISWDGGNDSGCFYLRLNGEEIDNDWDNKSDFGTQLLDWAADHLDYGSFAGDFDTDGELVYNPETKTFSGTDHYRTTDGGVVTDAGIRVEVPKNLWFDRLELEVDGQDDEIHSVGAELIVLNGPVGKEHEDWATHLEKTLEEAFENALQKAEEEFLDSSYNNYRINRSEFTEEGEMLVHVINDVTYSYSTTQDNEVTLDLNDYVEDHE